MGKERLNFPFKAADWFLLKQIAPGILAIREPHQFEDVLSFWVEGEKGSILFDTGMGMADIREVLPTTSDPLVLLTHSHWDHVGGAHQFNSVAIMNDRFEKMHLRRGWKPYEIVGYAPENFTIELPSGFDPGAFRIDPLPKFSTFHPDQTIHHAGITMKVIHTPGHSPGSTCFYIAEHGVVITGDTVYPGPEYLHLPESSPNAYTISLERIAQETQQHLRQILPGHNAFSSQPDLLTRHLQAARGLLDPIATQTGEDEFGKYTRMEWADFSFMLPRE